MNHAMLLDCTLRDGAYLIDKKFGRNAINGIISGLMNSGVDLIEIGFLQNEGFGEGKTVYKNSKDAEEYVPNDKKDTLFTVLADYSRYSIDNLDDYTGKSFDAVRACFFKKERYDVIDFCKSIKAKGYKLFVQPVDILGYSDSELIEFINMINTLEPYCLSIVDTFGSMYIDDLQRVFSLIDHNLIGSCKIGFHSHNNMQMSSALSQEFVRMSFGKRKVVVDATLSGMGRGAGNTPLELIAQYMVTKYNYNYDMDAILDVIDGYMDNIRSKCAWGYDTNYFIAGTYSAHVNNIAYLKNKSSIRYKDIRYILNKIGAQPRKRYNYDLLDSTYMNYIDSDIDDSEVVEKLKSELGNRNILVISPGKTATTEVDKIIEYKNKNNAIVITVNFMYDAVSSDYMYFSNVKRYQYWKSDKNFDSIKKIITSNITNKPEPNELVVSFVDLVKCGWECLDNSTILLLRLLDKLDVNSIAIAGFDGYDIAKSNYAVEELELSNVRDAEKSILLNKEIREMLTDYIGLRKSNCKIRFITDSRFDDIIGDNNE